MTLNAPRSRRPSVAPASPGDWAMMAGRIEHRIHSEDCNRVDWRSALRYAATAKRRWERDLLLLAFFV
jgi:hypothetical protein